MTRVLLRVRLPSLPCTHGSRVAACEDLGTRARPGFSVPNPSLALTHRVTLNKLSAFLSFALLTCKPWKPHLLQGVQMGGAYNNRLKDRRAGVGRGG